MYTAVNDRLIVMMPGEERTEGGIILDNSQEQGAVLRLEVVNAGEHERFTSKTVLVERRLVRELPRKGYGAVDVKDVLAVEA